MCGAPGGWTRRPAGRPAPIRLARLERWRPSPAPRGWPRAVCGPAAGSKELAASCFGSGLSANAAHNAQWDLHSNHNNNNNNNSSSGRGARVAQAAARKPTHLAPSVGAARAPEVAAPSAERWDDLYRCSTFSGPANDLRAKFKRNGRSRSLACERNQNWLLSASSCAHAEPITRQ